MHIKLIVLWSYFWIFLCSQKSFAISPYTPSFQIFNKTNINNRLLKDWNKNDSSIEFYKNTPLKRKKKYLHSKNLPFVVPYTGFSTSLTRMSMLRGENVEFSKIITAPNILSVFTYFGGSCSEGQILIPSPNEIIWAHKNGIDIVATIFFPDNCGSEAEEWYINFTSNKIDPVTKRPFFEKYAKILVEMAHTYKFDGFFINQESVPDSLSKRIVPLIQKIHKLDENLLVNFYQDDNSPQSELLSENGTQIADRYFINYGWQGNVKNWTKLVDEIGYPRKSLEFGINLEIPSYYDGTGQEQDFNETFKYGSSIALYDYPKIISKNNNTLDIREASQRNKEYFFGNPYTAWPGVYSYTGLSTTNLDLPFISDFSLGAGNYYFIRGEKVSKKKWMSTALQSSLPTWQFLSYPLGQSFIHAEYDFESAYNFGSSLSFKGEIDNKRIVFDLFATDLATQSENLLYLKITYKSIDYSKKSLCLHYNKKTEPKCYPLLANSSYWQTEQLQIPSSNKDIITKISLVFEGGNEDYYLDFRLGQIYIGEKIAIPKVPENVKIFASKDTTRKPIETYLYLRWQNDSNERYRIYGKNDNKLEFIIESYQNILEVSEWSNNSEICVAGVNKIGEESSLRCQYL